MSNKTTPSSGEHTSTASSFVPRPTTTLQTFLPEFWSHVIRHAESYQSDFKDGQLPLARIKKLVKSDPDIKMIANEVTVLLDKACEIRSFLVANSLNRRTVNTSDVALAISQSDVFDFLIDIVPTDPPEENSNTNVPSTSTSATPALPSKQRRQINAKVPDATDNQQNQSEWTSQEGSTSTTLPPAKKKIKKNKVNRNLLPEEIAVPIPDEELIPPERSYQFNSGSMVQDMNSNRRLFAIPIPDSELIPPQSSEPSWEMAVPITSNNQFSAPMGPPPPPVQSRSWELAVPISESTSTSNPPTWEMAVPIPDHGSSSSHHLSNLSLNPPNKTKRNWDLAVPIVDESHQSGSTQFKESNFYNSSHHHSLTSSSCPALNHHPQNSTNLNQSRTWELAVPITDEEQIEESNYNQSTSFQTDLNQEVPIDPALFNLSSSFKVESNNNSLDSSISFPFDPQNHHQQNLSIKEED